MKKVAVIGVILVLVICGVVLVFLSTKPQGKPEGKPVGKPVGKNGDMSEPGSDESVPPAEVVTIRLGYSPHTLINAHLGETFTRTNILENNYLKGEIKTYDTDNLLIEALKKGEVDVVFTVDVPAILALAQGYEGLIVGTFTSLGRTALMVPTDSPINLNRLTGSRIGVPFRSPAHRHLMKILKDKKLLAGRDVQLKNISETQKLIAGLANQELDAIVLSDPAVEECLLKKTYRSIADDQFYSVILMARGFYNQDPQVTFRFLTALKEAIYFTSKNRMEINKLVARKSGLSPRIVSACSLPNINLRARSITDVRISLTNFLPKLKRVAQYIHQQKLAPKLIDISKVIDPKIQQEASRVIEPDRFDPTKIKFNR